MQVQNSWQTVVAGAGLMVAACGQAQAPANANALQDSNRAARPTQTTAPSGTPTDEATEFAMGNVLFILFHEFGHAMISEFQLPVLGREEDAVDNFASVLLAPDANDPQRDASILTNAITSWFAYAEMTAFEDIQWWDEHGPDRQRAYQIACLLYGSEASAYGPLADAIELPPERRERCEVEYQSVFASWGQLLAPHVIEQGGAPGQRITVRYDASGDFAREEQMLKDSQILETLATEMSGSFRLPRALTMKAATCGEPNAFWDPAAAEITLCYELVRDYMELHRQLAAQPQAAAAQ